MILEMKGNFLFIKIFFIIFFFFYSQISNADQFSNFAKKPIYENPESEFEGFAIDVFLDKMIYYAYSLPKKAKSKHNGAIFNALTKPAHGENFSWEYGRFYGKVKMVISIKENNQLCRSWIEEIGIKNNRYKVGINKACFDEVKQSWVLVDDYYHLKN